MTQAYKATPIVTLSPIVQNGGRWLVAGKQPDVNLHGESENRTLDVSFITTFFFFLLCGMHH